MVLNNWTSKCKEINLDTNLIHPSQKLTENGSKI